MNTTNYIRIFRGDDSDALGYQTIVGTIKTDLDLTGCKAVFRFLGFYAEFDPIPEDKKLTIVIPAQASRGFPPGVGYASLKVLDALGKIRTFTNRIPVIVDTMTPSCGCGEFEVSFSPFPELEPLKIFIGPNADDFDQYTGFISKIIDRASLVRYGLVMLADAMGEDGGASGKAASPLAVKAAYDAIIATLTDNYYNAEQTEEAIDRVAAYYITYTAAGAAFPTYAALANATTVYSGGKVRVPTRNDYCVVLADETHQGAEYRYIYAVAEGATTGSWQAQFPVEGVMTIDQTVIKNSANPVAGGGVWSAIWGALASLPAGFSSLYDWCVAQLAGKASKADATLTPRYADEWIVNPVYPEGYTSYTGPTWNGVNWIIYYHGDSGELDLGILVKAPSYALSLSFSDGTTATRQSTEHTLIGGYSLGSQTDKPLASEAEAEALRTGKADKSTVDPLLFAQYYPEGNVKSAAEFTEGIKYDAPDTVNRTIAVKPFCNTGDSDNDNSSLVGRVVIPPFVDAHGNPYISDDGTRFKVVGVSDGSPYDDNTNLTTIVTPNTVTSIGEYALSGCTSLASVSLPAVTTIKYNAFDGSDSLASVDFGATPRPSVPTLGEYAFDSVPTTCKIIVPYAQYDAWIAASGWSALPQEFVRHAEKADKPATFTTGNLAALDANGNPTDSQIPAADVALKGNIPYTLGTSIVIDAASSETVEGETVNYGAATLADRTANVVQVTAPLDELRITFPAATSGKVRDFGLRVEIGTGSAALAAPALVPVAPSGETIKLENNAAEIPALADGTATAKGVALLYFSETSQGVFVVKGEQVEEVA